MEKETIDAADVIYTPEQKTELLRLSKITDFSLDMWRKLETDIVKAFTAELYKLYKSRPGSSDPRELIHAKALEPAYIHAGQELKAMAFHALQCYQAADMRNAIHRKASGGRIIKYG